MSSLLSDIRLNFITRVISTLVAVVVMHFYARDWFGGTWFGSGNMDVAIFLGTAAGACFLISTLVEMVLGKFGVR